MKIIHFSDIHAGGPAEDWMAYLDKRWVGVFNFRFRRKFQHDLSKLEKAVEFILREKPDLAVCTGDITSTGQPGEFKKSLDIMAVLAESSIPLIYVPGNHDYYVRNRKCFNALEAAFEFLNQKRYKFSNLPISEKYGGIEFLIVNESYPANLISSCGRVKKDTGDFIVRKCSEKSDSPIVLIGHYPLIEDHPVLRMRHGLIGRKRIFKLLASGQIDLSVCGHVHMPYARLDERGRGEICAGSVTRNSCMSMINYEAGTGIFSYEKINLK